LQSGRRFWSAARDFVVTVTDAAGPSWTTGEDCGAREAPDTPTWRRDHEPAFTETGACSGATLGMSDYFAPKNWLNLDNADLDMGTGPIVFDLPGAFVP